MYGELNIENILFQFSSNDVPYSLVDKHFKLSEKVLF